MLSKDKVRRSFSLAAPTYDTHAALQQEVAAAVSALVRQTPTSILDLGCGTGQVAIAVQKKYPQTHVYGLDIAEGMISTAQKRSITEHVPFIEFTLGDMEHIPYPEQSFDLVVSSLSLQWLNSLEPCFREIARVLHSQGSLVCSTLGPNSLQELRSTYFKLFNTYPLQHTLPDKKEIQTLLHTIGFTDIQIITKTLTYYFTDFYALAHSMKKIGAKAQHAQFLSRKNLQKLIEAYPHTKQGLPLTYEIYIITGRIYEK